MPDHHVHRNCAVFAGTADSQWIHLAGRFKMMDLDGWSVCRSWRSSYELAAVAGAVEDALTPFNVPIDRVPIPPRLIYAMMQGRHHRAKPAAG
jgi:hypothetical protein